VAPFVGAKNFLINGGQDIWQRGATGLGTSTGSYTADRWVLGSSSTTVTRDTDVPVSPYFQYSLKMVGTGDNSLIQRIEASNSTLLAGQTITFSFYAKRTSGTGALDVRFYYPTTADTYGAVTQIGSTVVVSASPASSWTRYTVTAAIGTNITTGLQVLINNTGATTTFITGAQLELGSVATPFARAGGSIGGELALCQRYYYRVNSTLNANSFLSVLGTAPSTTAWAGAFALPVTMRSNVSAIDYSGMVWYDGTNAVSISTLTLNQTHPSTPLLYGTGTGLTAFRPYYLFANNSTSAYLGFSAEL
jgi:hypothetical protein